MSQHTALHISFSVSESQCFLWYFTQESQITFKLLFYSDKFTRFCQWKNVELNIHVSTYTYIYLVKGWRGEENVQFWILLLKRPYQVQGVLLIRCSILRHAALAVPFGHPFCLPWADSFGIAVRAARSWAAPIVSPSESHCSCSTVPALPSAFLWPQPLSLCSAPLWLCRSSILCCSSVWVRPSAFNQCRLRAPSVVLNTVMPASTLKYKE